ncbi:hypothetical protein HMJ29_18360 [Hymenobacter taeanensis]|uniref:GTPase n=1 Tax=Hymenobacter taeanensis TaxID=2735321 RepID=A0A6M6BMT9_9BACT|nr:MULTISPECIES: hypothetical protein [Hymenobacter]QJX48773.1 hypothetical protein HMJ29_18360 [Hymenobacter taeanensis]UOQ81722.1 hypothetical protein MUN83_02715 [Hymenobacter sp. 5414T-23]
MAAPKLPELLFVYNADAGVVNGLLDMVHKLISPATYSCSLCALTYGAATMRPEWRAFLKQLPARATFLHRDELRRQHPELAAQPLPVVMRRQGGLAWQPFLTATELASASELQQLIQLIQSRL